MLVETENANNVGNNDGNTAGQIEDNLKQKQLTFLCLHFLL
jgi:hypothetical protein